MSYNVIDYGGMLADQGRTSSYNDALRALVRPGAVVLDIGAGLGAMSFMAVRAGAARVYAVESDDIIELGRQIAADNGISSQVIFIRALTTEIDLPEPVDGIVTDLHGRSPFYQNSLGSILDARRRFLKPDGWIIPTRDTVWAAPATATEMYDRYLAVWSADYQVDFSSARLKAANNIGGVRVGAGDLVAPPQRFAVVDYKRFENINVDLEMQWTIDRAARAHGLCTWFDCETAEGMGFSNSPLSSERHIYAQHFFPWPQAVELQAGDQVKVRLRADFVETDYAWSWRTRIVSGERVAAEFRQSTFTGAPLSPERMRKRGSRFVPDPNEDLAIDRLVLDLMQRRLSLDEIAKALQAEFPARFKHWNAALARVADLSERYSK